MALAMVLAAGCASGGSTVIRYPYPAPADTGHVQLALSPVVRSAQVFIDDKHVGFVEGPVDVLVLHNVPIGFRHIVIRQAGSLQHARVEVVPRIVTHGKTTLAFAGPHPQPPSLSPPPVTPARRRKPESPAPRPCGGKAFVIQNIHFLPLPGIRLCQPVGSHLSLELQVTYIFAALSATAGASVDLLQEQNTPYLTFRSGVFGTIITAGSLAYAGIGWKHRQVFIDAGLMYLRFQTEDGGQMHRDWLPGITFGID